MSEEEVTPSDIYLQPEVGFERGKKYLIKANSGHGKTSFLDIIYGSNKSYTGEVDFGYEDELNAKERFDLRVSNLSYVFQDYKLFNELTLFENIQLKNTLTKHRSEEEINIMIEVLQLGHRKNSLVKTLSLGQKQRVAIIRALCQPFEMLLLDEPFSHVDDKNIDIITTMINKELEYQQAGFILTSLGSEYLFNYDKILNL